MASQDVTSSSNHAMRQGDPSARWKALHHTALIRNTNLALAYSFEHRKVGRDIFVLRSQRELLDQLRAFVPDANLFLHRLHRESPGGDGLKHRDQSVVSRRLLAQSGRPVFFAGDCRRPTVFATKDVARAHREEHTPIQNA